MTFIEAQQIITTLASGLDPSTGEVLPEHSLVGGNARVVRALFMAAGALQAAGQRVSTSSPPDARPSPDAPAASDTLSATSAPAPRSPPDSTRPLALPARSNRPPMAGKPWSEDEDAKLAAAFDAGASVKDLTLSHGRSRGGISSRLLHLGKITEQSGAAPRMRGGAPA